MTLLPDFMEFMGRFAIRQSLWNEFQTPALPTRLQAGYPQLFDLDDDLRLAHTQPDMYCKNWFAAIDLFERRGLQSIQAMYEMPNHVRKHTVFRNLMPETVCAFLEGRDRELGPPSLLTFTGTPPASRRCQFVHVEHTQTVDGDRLLLFEHLAELSGLRIGLVCVHVGVSDGTRRFELTTA